MERLFVGYFGVFQKSLLKSRIVQSATIYDLIPYINT